MKLKNRSIKTVIIFTYFVIFSIILGSTYAISYVSFSNHIKEANDELILETANQITYNYENYVSNIIHTADLIQQSVQTDESQNHQNTEEYFDFLLLTKGELQSIQIYSIEDGKLLISDSKSSEITNVTSSYWFHNAITDDTIHFLTPIISDKANYNIRFSKVIPIDKSNKKALLTLEIDFQEILDLNYKTNLGEGGHVMIIDDDYRVVYSSNRNFPSEEINILKDMILGLRNYSVDGHDYTISLNSIPNSRWRLAVFYNVDNVQTILYNYLFLIAGVLLFVFLIGASIIFMVSKQITDPIKNLEKAMSRIDESGPIMIKDIEKGTKEIVSLSSTYNDMIYQINKLMKQVVVEQTNQRKSELKALQYQINPHFLYNTLDSIVWLIDNDKKNEAQNMVIALAKLFRISISRGRNIIPVRDEIEHVRNYLFIQSMRYTDSFEYHIDVDEECYNYQVMKLILQPLVENCIYHGLKNRIDKGIITITGHMEEQNLILTIEDNGYGILPEKIEELYKRFDDPDLNDGVGLKNVYQRLRIYYGEQSYLKIESEVDEYTRIIISIPVEEIKNEN